VLLATHSNSVLALADHPDLSAAILDSQRAEVRRRLEARGVPFLFYTARDQIEGESASAPMVRKPAAPTEVVARVEQLMT